MMFLVGMLIVVNIYPASLTLNKENEVNDKANVLDLNVSIIVYVMVNSELKFMINGMIFRSRLSNFREKIVIYPATLHCFTSVSITDCEIF